MAAMNCAAFLSPTEGRLEDLVYSSPSLSVSASAFLLRDGNTLGKTYEMLYPLTSICPVYCWSMGAMFSLPLKLVVDFGTLLEDNVEAVGGTEILKTLLNESDDRAGRLRARAAL
jgi:hypothetical protein